MMRFNLSELAVRERAITVFLIVAIILSGIYAFSHLGRAEDPAFTIKNFTVTAVWPGATAQEMQNLVADLGRSNETTAGEMSRRLASTHRAICGVVVNKVAASDTLSGTYSGYDSGAPPKIATG